MGRYISGVSGASGDATADANVLGLVAGGTVTTRDLVLAAEDGYVYKANPLFDIAQLNNNTAGAVNIASSIPLESNVAYGLSSSAMRNIVTFPTGEVIVAYTGDGSTATTGVQFSIRNIKTGSRLSKVAVSADNTVSGSGVGVERLGDTKFIIWWFVSAVIKFAVYNKDGTVSVEETTGPSVATAVRAYAACRSLTAGDFVFAYGATDGSARFTRYNSSGVVQGAEVQIESGAQNARFFNVIALDAGGFICQYYNAATIAWKFARYSASGVIQGSLVSAPNSFGQTSLYSNFDQIGIELDGLGKIAVMRRSNVANNSWFIDIYSAANTLLRSINIQPSGVNPDCIGSIVKTENGFATILYGQYCRKFSIDGDQIVAEVSVSAISGLTYSNGGSYSSTWIEPVPSGFVVLRQADNVSTMALQLAVLAPDFSLRGSVLTLRVAGGNPVYGPCLAIFDSVAIVGHRDGASSPVIGSYLTSRTSIIGVAQAPAVAGDSVIVDSTGSFTLTEAYPLGGSFDSRTNTAPGNRGALSGRTALLLGNT